jgi:transcription-repair coupling factor (superfamily II helicase)
MIQTPPEERLPVVTHVGTFNEQLVRQAILRELERGGQTFVVHNRVKSIDALREQLEEIVPEARMATAHGQMNERTLEKVMSAFARGEFDVLISTAIVENGIDIPNANTLIVDRADWFGLAQLYQLRGRVGRGAQQAYAYFFYHKSGRLTEEARERLNTLAENTHLGAGYQIAMRDLEIRGAGDILSTRQTGHVAAVGLNLYTQLLTQAIQKLKGSRGSEPTPPAATSGIIINLPLPAYIPRDWITEISLRLQIYRRIGDLYRLDQVDDMERELQDRFGRLPDAVAGLLYQIRVKLLAQRAGATAVMLHEGLTIQVKLPYLYQLDRVMVRQELGDDVQVTRTAVEIPLGVGETWRTRLLEVLEALAQRGITAGTPA